MVHGQTQIYGSGRMTFGVGAVVVPLPQADFRNLEADGMQ
jgi:hypothetical protein